ncbi:MAG: MotA/TolQ/ExbB proton channel family protein [Candidatus Aenigmatarchaeota archaeon]
MENLVFNLGGIFKWIVKGGPLVVPIVICSIFALAIIIERLLFYHHIRFDRSELLSKIFDLVKKNRITEAIEVCEKKPLYLTNILKAGLLKYDQSKEVIREAMEDASLYEIPKLEKNLNFLNTISHISPLLGLLGTVVGLVICFYTIEQKAINVGVVNPSDLARGIYQALITTVLGLCVAIPGYIAYHYFVHKVDIYILEAERAATELLEILSLRRYQIEV